jgi:hypothetical protein
LDEEVKQNPKPNQKREKKKEEKLPGKIKSSEFLELLTDDPFFVGVESVDLGDVAPS